ncbi:MAG: ATP-binding protein [Thermoflexibacter sp.]|nr:ATP-binding protein [Thermoflexibacter sp.]
MESNQAFDSTHQPLYLPASRNMMVILEHYLTEIYSQVNQHIYQSKNFDSDNELLILRFMEYVRRIKAKFEHSGGLEELIKEEKNLFGNPNEKLLNELIQKVNHIIKGQYGVDEYGEKIQFGKNRKDYIRLINASSGQQEIIRPFQDIFLSVLYNDTVFRVYEEPEAHLFPLGQKGYIELIAMLINANPQSQIVIPTHSPYILTALDNLIKAKYIVQRQPELEEEVNLIIPQSQWLDFEQVGIYALKDGELYDSLDRERKGLKSDVLDDTTEKMSAIFDQLLNLQYQVHE